MQDGCRAIQGNAFEIATEIERHRAVAATHLQAIELQVGDARFGGPPGGQGARVGQDRL